jgi:hypothetical protein
MGNYTGKEIQKTYSQNEILMTKKHAFGPSLSS